MSDDKRLICDVAATNKGLARRFGRLLHLWFGLSQPVGPVAYGLSGLGLMLFKYAVETGVIYVFTGRYFTPVDFLNPLLSMRQSFYALPAPDWLPWAMFLWSLPFLWICVSMSVRRAEDAGSSAWNGLLVLVPVLNLLLMVMLSFAPSLGVASTAREVRLSKMDNGVRSAMLGILATIPIALMMVFFSVYGLKDYGASLFLGTPIVIGAVSSAIYNRSQPRTLGGSLFVAHMAIVMCGLTVLLFALEGIICLAMLYPVAAAMGLLGGMIGHALGTGFRQSASNIMLPIAFLPLWAGAETTYRPDPLFETQSSIEIDAPPERVWPHVAGFTELPAPPDWYFRLGIAYPQRARIEGAGVGSIRHCEFSTGAFVEPITVWDEPSRLAFDVQSQPPPMHELSPYRHVHPPHLDGYLRCRKGEFRLTPLPGGRTRLEGSTWYEFDIHPQDYWTLWSDLLIHRIHMRVLKHVKSLAEAR